MPLWPFGRKKRRTSNSSQAATSAISDACNEKTRVLDPRRDMTCPTQTSAWPPSRRESQRKRKTATGGSDATSSMDEKHADPPLRNTSAQDITALPGVPEVESSPHLRPVKPHKAVVSYNLDRATVSNPGHHQSTPGPPAVRSHQATRTQYPQRGRSMRRRDDSREEHVQMMTSPIAIQTPKRPAGANHDLLRRDSKKARRTLQKPRPDDHRASTVSLPLSVPSAMSARSEERGWAVGIIDVLSPRPTVRLSVPGCCPQDGSNTALSHKGSKKGGKLPAIAQESSKKDRRRVADLADDLDSSDLRTVLERDARRQEQKATKLQERLERKLRKRAEKQRAEEETERERESEREREREREHEQKQRQKQEHGHGQNQEQERRAVERALPTAVHPAFRDRGPDEHALTGSTWEDGMNNESLPRGGTYLNYPPHQDIPQNPFDDPEHEHSPFADAVPDPTSAATEHWSPVQTPLDEPVLETARFVRLSQGHISPPASPSPIAQPAASLSESSDLQSQRTTSIPRPLTQSQRRVSESSSRRTGTWASFFRRGPSASRTSVDYASKPNASEASFTNVSRESMSRQAQQNIPAHLIDRSGPRSRTPARTRSRFHEDLPDAPMSPPDSRVQSPELSTVAANVASALRGKRTAQQIDLSSSSEPMNVGRTDSPVVPEEVPLSHSLASIDSEGSWISGRPVHRRSTTRVQRESTASVVSADRPNNDFTGSYERLPIPEHEFFSALTSNAASQRTSGEVPATVEMNTTSAATQVGAGGSNTDVDTPLRHGTAHRRPTVVHNEPRFKSREGLVGEFMADSAAIPSRASSVSEQESPGNSPIEQATLQKASSVNYGHSKSLSAGSARLLNIRSSRHGSDRTSPAGSPALQQSEFEKLGS
ncbi:hypothetical protein BDV97DRAFT_212585 [Delphinella strobiligena]|nr:hypothetical protein BDV97DRAFT_212585 [Delphinella strobiligena]